jgi:hypothetical protein
MFPTKKNITANLTVSVGSHRISMGRTYEVYSSCQPADRSVQLVRCEGISCLGGSLCKWPPQYFYGTDLLSRHKTDLNASPAVSRTNEKSETEDALKRSLLNSANRKIRELRTMHLSSFPDYTISKACEYLEWARDIRKQCQVSKILTDEESLLIVNRFLDIVSHLRNRIFYGS